MGRPLLDQAIDRVYDAASGDTAWEDAVGSMVRLHGAERAILFTPTVTNRDGGLWAMHDVPDDVQRRYVHEYRERDLWLERGMAAGHMRSGNTVLGQELVQDAELRRTAIYADVLRGAGLFHLCSSILFDGTDRGMPPVLFAMFRAEKAAPFSAREKARFNEDCRHVSRAVRIWYKARAPSSGADALAESLRSPALVVRRDLRVTWMNRAAEAWAKAGRLAVREGRLAALHGYEGSLGALVQRASEGPVIEAGEPRAPVSLEAIPASLAPAFGGEGQGQRGVLLVVREHGASRALEEALRTRFGLTRAEVDLALAIAGGTQLAEYAAGRGVSMSTVRTQVKAVLAKTGCRRQGELVATIDRLRPLLAVPCGRAGIAP